MRTTSVTNDIMSNHLLCLLQFNNLIRPCPPYVHSPNRKHKQRQAHTANDICPPQIRHDHSNGLEIEKARAVDGLKTRFVQWSEF